MRTTARLAALAIAILGAACSEGEGDRLSWSDGGHPDGDLPGDDHDAGRNGPDALEGTLVEGSPTCAEPVPCCFPDSPALPGVTATSATVASIEQTEEQTLVHLTIDDEVHSLVLPGDDLEVGDELELERTGLGLVVRDELGVLAVFGAAGGDGAFDAEITVAEATLRPVLSCHGFTPHQGAFYGCPDALIADYALRLGDVEVNHGEQTDVVLAEGTFHVRNDLIRRRVGRGDGFECGDYWHPTMRFSVVRRAK
ncbi:MAG: hypothetical protein MUE69_21825 [Myxococcota bacterium]|jgi:hypothetical protein|nr:hypothetical protein [Myxococcota bacterium]